MNEIEKIEQLEQQIRELSLALQEVKREKAELESELEGSESAWSGIWEMDVRTQQLHWSPEMYMLLGIEESTPPNMLLLKEKMSPSCIDKLNGALKKTIVSQKEYSFEHLIINENLERDARMDLKPIIDESGQIVKLIGKLTDITEMKSSMKELEKLSLIASGTSNAVAVLDVDTNIEWINNSFTLITGYRIDEVKDVPLSYIISRNEDETYTKHNFEEEFQHKLNLTYETKIYDKKGQKIFVVINISPILDFELNPESYIVLITDITQQKLTERKVETQNKEITASITYAKRIQEAILPAQDYFKKYVPDSFIFYKPRDIVAGDFYWLETFDNQVIFAVADCTGHGVPGAMVSVVCHNAMNRAVKEFNLRQPSLILDKVRDLVIETFSQGNKEIKDGMDISLCNWNTETNVIQFAGAYNTLVWVKNGPDGRELIEIKGDKQPIGKFFHHNLFQNQQLQCRKGDCLYLYSDGYADQFGGQKGEKFMKKRLKAILLENSSLPMEQQHRILDEKLMEWQGEEFQVDDVCIIGVRV